MSPLTFTYLPGLMPSVKPFLKWAGGKTQLLDQFSPLFPKTFNDYYEPFVGSAAVFFFLFMQRVDGKLNYRYAYLSDINDELINTYMVVRNDLSPLIDLLRIHRQSHNKDYYYHIRSLIPDNLSVVERAARFIYLNKTCFNGLYRVNRSGQFNVPMGSYKNPQIFNERELGSVSIVLNSVSLSKSPYTDVLNHAKEGDFIYFDPPYYPLSKTSNFTSYSIDSFSEADQIELRDTFVKLDQLGCKVMLSNSWADFILDLYKGFNIIEVKAKRKINSDPEKRGKISELVVLNYDVG